MKLVKWVIILLMLIVIITTPLAVSALDAGLTTQPLSDEEISDIVKQRKFVKITSYTPLAAKCFDVRDDHIVVIGADSGNTAIIAVYDDCGNFQYGFETEEPGSFRVMWSGDAIAYYSIRSTFVYHINQDGEITNIYRVESTTENSIYDRDVLLSTTRTIGTDTYRMTNESAFADTLSTSFKKIIKTDSKGTAVIYDASGNKHTRVVGGLIVALLLSAFLVSSIVMGIKKYCKSTSIRHQSKTGDGSVFKK